MSHLSVFGHTDSNRKFLIAGLPEDWVHIGVLAPKHVRAGATVALRAGPCGHVDIRLQAANTISFRVRDRRGRPIAAAIAQSTAVSTRADDNGSVELIIPPETGPIECTISARAYKPKSVTLDPKAPPQVIVLEYGDLFAGRVLSESGKAVSGARVTIIGSRRGTGIPARGPVPAPVINMPEGAVETDADGRFSLAVSGPPVTAVRVVKRGYVEQRLAIEGVNALRDVEIRLQPADAGIFGRVTDSDGNPIQRFSISLSEGTAPGSQAYSRSFDNADGRFSVTDIAPGFYSVFVRGDLPGAILLRLGQIEIRRGYWYGEVAAQFPPAKDRVFRVSSG